jgi:predicted component of type VI protein secretion system
VILLGLLVLTGCGSRYINVNVERTPEAQQPAWVGVYFLELESALSGRNYVELADPDAVPIGGGVVDKVVFSLPPGKTRNIERKEYDERIRWIVVAAGFPGSPECAGKKLEVEKGAELDLIVTVYENCIDTQLRQ